jgi:hypothetical protein
MPPVHGWHYIGHALALPVKAGLSSLAPVTRQHCA